MSNSQTTTFFEWLAAKYEPASTCKNGHLLIFIIAVFFLGFSAGMMVAHV